jgi:8-amino-7-oxononanoate synthase
MSSLDRFAKSKLAELDATHLRRDLVESARTDGLWLTRGGRQLLSFSCNDYLSMTHHPQVKAAAAAALVKYGAGAGASRLVTGNHPLYAELETRLAKLKGTQAACVFGSGYLANAGIIPAVVGEGDLLVVDALSHSCFWAGARLSRGVVMTFRHNEVGHARELLAKYRSEHRHALIVTDRVFSMDGDLAPLDELSALARDYDAWLMADDAHGLAVVEGKIEGVDLQMGTLSKTLGSYGGYLCASEPVIALMRTRARTLIYSTGLPPANIAAAIAALDVIKRDPALARRPLEKARAFTLALGLPQAQSPVVPLILGEALRALQAQAILEGEGFLVTAIRPPTVPSGTARLRFAFAADHPDHEIARLARIVRERIL